MHVSGKFWQQQPLVLHARHSFVTLRQWRGRAAAVISGGIQLQPSWSLLRQVRALNLARMCGSG